MADFGALNLRLENLSNREWRPIGLPPRRCKKTWLRSINKKTNFPRAGDVDTFGIGPVAGSIGTKSAIVLAWLQMEDDDGWEFKSAEWRTKINSRNVKAEVPKHDNNALEGGTVLGSSTEISNKADRWHLEFEFNPSSVLQDHISQQLGTKSELNEIGTRFTMFNQTFEELNSGSRSNQNVEALKMADMYPTNIDIHKLDGAAQHGTVDSYLASESRQSDEWGFSFNFNSSFPSEDNHTSESYFKTKPDQDDNNKNNASPTNINVDSDVNLFESKYAVTEIGTKHEKPQAQRIVEKSCL
ncbi:hypothetical protein VNO77_03666 [Canavalia gladiata]|uniref:Uncharacterized protein n=1 Tax=Canavalia gladiata TaxID=3824 RepID=A0AAN9R723_CANGL